MNRLMPWVMAIVFAVSAAVPVRADEQALVKAPDIAAACATCHGPGGNQPISPETPRLAGQEYSYLAHALRQYRDGVRQNPIMRAMAKSLSDSQIEVLARYFAAQPGLTVKY
jgi:cytochrome c553